MDDAPTQDTHRCLVCEALIDQEFTLCEPCDRVWHRLFG